MLRKVPCDDSIVDKAAEKPPVRAIRAVMDSKRPRLVLQQAIPSSPSLKEDYVKVQGLLTEAEPCIVLVRLKDQGTTPAKDDDWLVVVWVPPTVPGPQRALWGTSTDSIVEEMPNCRIKGLEAVGKSDVSWEKFLAVAESLTGKQLPIFFDMKHSNNSARIRLWVALKEGMKDKIESRVLTEDKLKDPEFTRVSPLQQVPAYRRTDGVGFFDSDVILSYLEDKYSDQKPSFMPDTPEDRQSMHLMVRIHDIYISASNCNAPGFTSTQAAMYTSSMDLATRAAKLAEIWKQLGWLNKNMVLPYLCGSKVTLADLTWFPTTVYMEFLLPRLYGWPDIFRKTDGPFPNLAKWWAKISEEPAYKAVRADIFKHWEEVEKKGQFKPIITEVASDKTGLKFKYP